MMQTTFETGTQGMAPSRGWLATAAMLLAMTVELLAGYARAGGQIDEEYRLSRPAESSMEKQDKAPVTLPDLIDARGLALLLGHDEDARALAGVVERFASRYRTVVEKDKQLADLVRAKAAIFERMLGSLRIPAARLGKELEEHPERRWREIAARWLRLALWRQGVYFQQDLERLGRDERMQLCREFAECSSPSRMPSWRLRYLLWLARDREVLSLSRKIDERRRMLTPVELDELDGRQRRLVERYLRMLGMLRFRASTEKDSGKARTLRGTLRGLRYVETLRRACRATGLDYILMFRLLIQESAFIHERVSWAGAFSVAQFLNIALKDVWMFRKKIPGAAELLGSVKDEQDLKRRVVSDPHMAIRVACLYFRRLRDEVVLRLGHRQSVDARMRDLVTLELYSLRQAMERATEIDGLIESRKALGPEEVLVPLGPTPLPDPAVALSKWIEKLVTRLVEKRVTEELFEQRLQRLYDALGLAAYNAGMQNLLRAARKRKKLSALAFPLEIEETRNYVDDILDGADFLRKLERELSPFSEMSFDELLQVVLPFCE